MLPIRRFRLGSRRFYRPGPYDNIVTEPPVRPQQGKPDEPGPPSPFEWAEEPPDYAYLCCDCTCEIRAAEHCRQSPQRCFFGPRGHPGLGQGWQHACGSCWLVEASSRGLAREIDDGLDENDNQVRPAMYRWLERPLPNRHQQALESHLNIAEAGALPARAKARCRSVAES